MFEVLVFVDAEVGVVEELELELVVVLDGEIDVLGAGLDRDGEVEKVAVGLTLETEELDCTGELDWDTVVVVPGFCPPPAVGVAKVIESPAFGHSVETPFPTKIIPINVLG